MLLLRHFRQDHALADCRTRACLVLLLRCCAADVGDLVVVLVLLLGVLHYYLVVQNLILLRRHSETGFIKHELEPRRTLLFGTRETRNVDR